MAGEQAEQAEQDTREHGGSRIRARRDADQHGGHDTGHDQQDGHARRRRHGNGQLNAARAARIGLEQIADLTGKEPGGVAAVERSEDGWTVGVEVIEDRRVPSSADVLAMYQADLSEDGELVGYRRVRRYKRGQGDTDYNGESW